MPSNREQYRASNEFLFGANHPFVQLEQARKKRKEDEEIAQGGYGGYTMPLAADYWSPEYGGVPKVPNVSATTKSALTGTTELMPEITKLTQDVNDLNTAQRVAQYNIAMPNYGQAVAQSSQNILSGLRADVPADVKKAIEDAAAERGVASGMPGSGLAQNDYLRSLGLTSLQMQQNAERQLTEALGRAPSPPLYSPASFFINPQEAYQSQLLANVYASSPVPSEAQRANFAAAQAGLRAGYQTGQSAGNPTQSYLPTSFTSPVGAPQTVTTLTDIYNRYSGTSGMAPMTATQGQGWGVAYGGPNTMTTGAVPPGGMTGVPQNYVPVPAVPAASYNPGVLDYLDFGGAYG